MKHKIVAIFFSLVMMFGISACSSKIGAIEQAFVLEGYQWQKIGEVDAQTKQAGVKAIFTATKGLTGLAIIIELQGSQEVAEVIQAIKEDPNFDGEVFLQALLSVYTDSPLTNGNCMIITLTQRAQEIFQNA
jgi:hypothetical protein